MPLSSLERIYPDAGGESETIAGSDTIGLHMERYQFAGEHLAPGRIADVACGSGYGSYLLATKFNEKIIGITSIDNNSEAFAYANSKYQHPLIRYVQEDAFSFQPSEPFNTIISLETIEHLEKPENFVHYYSEQLIKGGRFIASAPVVPTMDGNPYHKQDFTITSFKKLFINAGLTEITSMLQVQQYNPFQLRNKNEKRTKEIRRNLALYYLKNPKKLFLRLQSILKDGFTIKYLVVVYEKH